MQTGFPAASLVAAIVALCACRGDAAVNAAAPVDAAPSPVAREATSLPLLWQGARGLNIFCVASGDADGERLRNDLCARVRTIAAAGAPLPVRIVAPGDPAILDPDAVALLVHASVASEDGKRLLAFSIRPTRSGGAGRDLLFGAAPRAIRLPQSGAATAALDAALAAALAECLPWLAGSAGMRPISN